MVWNDSMRDLLELLVRQYPDPVAARNLAQRAGLGTGRIPVSDADAAWTAIFNQASDIPDGLVGLAREAQSGMPGIDFVTLAKQASESTSNEPEKERPREPTRHLFWATLAFVLVVAAACLPFFVVPILSVFLDEGSDVGDKGPGQVEMAKPPTTVLPKEPLQGGSQAGKAVATPMLLIDRSLAPDLPSYALQAKPWIELIDQPDLSLRDTLKLIELYSLAGSRREVENRVLAIRRSFPEIEADSSYWPALTLVGSVARVAPEQAFLLVPELKSHILRQEGRDSPEDQAGRYYLHIAETIALSGRVEGITKALALAEKELLDPRSGDEFLVRECRVRIAPVLNRPEISANVVADARFGINYTNAPEVEAHTMAVSEAILGNLDAANRLATLVQVLDPANNNTFDYNEYQGIAYATIALAEVAYGLTEGAGAAFAKAEGKRTDRNSHYIRRVGQVLDEPKSTRVSLAKMCLRALAIRLVGSKFDVSFSLEDCQILVYLGMGYTDRLQSVALRGNALTTDWIGCWLLAGRREAEFREFARFLGEHPEHEVWRVATSSVLGEAAADQRLTKVDATILAILQAHRGQGEYAKELLRRHYAGDGLSGAFKSVALSFIKLDRPLMSP